MTKTAMRIRTAFAEDVHDVAIRMRNTDFAELSAVGPHTCRSSLALSLATRFGHGEALLVARGHGPNECRVAIGATICWRPHVVSLLFFATDELPSVALPLTRFIRNSLFAELRADGIRRIEAIAMASHAHSRKWLKVLGLAEEAGPFRGYGRDGEDFYQFAWTSCSSA